MNYLSVFLIAFLGLFTSCEEKTIILTSQERLQNRLNEFVTDKPQLAISAAIIKNDQLSTAVAGRSFDQSSFDDQRLFLAGSTTKVFVAALAIKWTDENEISLDAKLSEFLPANDRFSGDITIRQLLTHTSGLGDYVTDDYLDAVLGDPSHVFTKDELLSYIPEPVATPGEEFFYSNTNYLLIGMLLEEWSQSTLAELLRSAFLNINASHTSFYPFESLQGEIEHLWTDIDGDNVSDDLTEMGFTPEALLSGAWASGGIVSTPGDLAQLLKSLLEGGILSDNQLSTMQQFNEIVPDQYAYGMGLQQFTSGSDEWIGHDGSLLHYTMLFYHADSGSYVAIMANQEDHDFDGLLMEIADILE